MRSEKDPNSSKQMIHVAIPAMNEAGFLPVTIRCLLSQTLDNYEIWVCVNQPDQWWDDPEKKQICLNNQKTLDYLYELKNERIRVIDCSSKGKGWKGKAFGVGQARKHLMDAIHSEASDDDLIVSLDADTQFDRNYLQSINNIFNRFSHAIALSNPYYHKRSGDDPLDRAMLRYEIYMRHYAINMWRIRSPYSFTALGSAIALPISSYRKIGGITAKKSGEDFYFLQKLRKAGWICNHNHEKVYPGTRYSDRVFFGTGPALIKGRDGNWESYPIYDFRLFDQVRQTYESFSALYHKSFETAMTAFLARQFREEDPFKPLRKNSATPEQFVTACHQKVDGLRVLQYLKAETVKSERNDALRLIEFLDHHKNIIPEKIWEPLQKAKYDPPNTRKLMQFGFNGCPIDLLDAIRNYLMAIEVCFQRHEVGAERQKLEAGSSKEEKKAGSSKLEARRKI